MVVDYLILSLAILLLWCPRQLLRWGTKVIGRSTTRKPELERAPQDTSLKLQGEFGKVRNWVDLARAATGAQAVNYACFTLEPSSAKNWAIPLLALKSILLIVAVVVQTSRFKRRLQFSAPIFFILGLSFGLIGLKAAIFAFVAVWTISLTISSPGMFLLVFSGLELGFGLLLERGRLNYILLAVGLTLIPILLSGMIRRNLVKLKKPRRGRRA